MRAVRGGVMSRFGRSGMGTWDGVERCWGVATVDEGVRWRGVKG